MEYAKINKHSPQCKKLLSEEEIKKVFLYTKESYFNHFRLYNYVLNNKQLSEVKRVFLKVDEPSFTPSLDKALVIGKETADVDDDAAVRLTNPSG